MAAVERHHAPLGSRDRERNRRARRRRCRRRARADRALAVVRKVRQHRERIEHVVRDHALGLADRGQVVRAVPFREQLEIAQPACRARRSAMQRRRPRGQRARRSPRRDRALVHAGFVTPSAACRRRAHSAFVRGRRRREAALQMHEQQRDRGRRDAGDARGLAEVSGRCRLSFCCTSAEKPRTDAVVEVERAAAAISCARSRAISVLLAIDVARVFGRDLDLLGDHPHRRRLAGRRAASSATHR